jgi:hypothetical protein
VGIFLLLPQALLGVAILSQQVKLCLSVDKGYTDFCGYARELEKTNRIKDTGRKKADGKW